MTLEEYGKEFRRQVFYAAIQGLCASIGGAEGYTPSRLIDVDGLVTDAYEIARTALKNRPELL